jgi:hypothetical protein
MRGNVFVEYEIRFKTLTIVQFWFRLPFIIKGHFEFWVVINYD